MLEEYLDESLWVLPSANAPSSTTVQRFVPFNEALYDIVITFL